MLLKMALILLVPFPVKAPMVTLHEVLGVAVAVGVLVGPEVGVGEFVGVTVGVSVAPLPPGVGVDVVWNSASDVSSRRNEAWV